MGGISVAIPITFLAEYLSSDAIVVFFEQILVHHIVAYFEFCLLFSSIKYELCCFAI